MLSDTLPPSPLYDPKAKVIKFKFSEDLDNIRLNLSGTGLLYEDLSFYYYLKDLEEGGIKGNFQATEWRRPKDICSSPKFINIKPDRFDALQGKLSDCWAVAAMETLTLNEQLINHVVPPDQSFDDNYIGAFHFRIWDLGVWYDVVVDDRLPTFKKSKKLCYCRSRSEDVFWAALLEKAYAKFWVTDKVSYDILGLGVFSTSLINFTGGIVEIICPNPDVRKDLPDGAIFGQLPDGVTLKTLLREAYNRNALMNCGCFDSGTTETFGLLPGHGYALTDIYKCADDDPDCSSQGVGLYLLRLLNPWGKLEFKGVWSDKDDITWGKIDKKIRDKLLVTREDGEFWISEEDFEKHFLEVCICHLGPGQYADTRYLNFNRPNWKTTYFRGEWVKGVSAVGADPQSRHQLPQYGIELKTLEDAQLAPWCYVVIHLIHKAKYRRYDIDCPPTEKCKEYSIGFYVYDTTVDAKDIKERLGADYFKKNKAVNEEPNWVLNDGRSYALGLTLVPGRYCILPCTEKADEESQFLLRVFTLTNGNVDEWEYDPTILKSSPLVDENLNHNDEWIRSLFIETAQDYNEIDWIGLKCIIDVAFNPTPHSSGIFTSIANYVLSVFGMFSSTSTSNDLKDENVNFTKDQCRSMIAMLDHNHSGKLDFSEFSELWNKISFWEKVYIQHRDEKVGHLKVHQLKDALGAIGYDVNLRTVHSLSYVYADDGKILLTDFILCGVALETALSRLEKEALESGKKMTMTLEEWVKNTLIL